MNDTAFLHLTNAAMHFAVFCVAAFIAVLLAHQVRRYIIAKSDAGAAQAPKFPLGGVVTKSLLLIAVLMFGMAMNVWLPKAEVVTPAVNSTMKRQILEDAERDIEIKPVVVPSATDAQGRQDRINEIREQFEALPDDE